MRSTDLPTCEGSWLARSGEASDSPCDFAIKNHKTFSKKQWRRRRLLTDADDDPDAAGRTSHCRQRATTAF